MLKPRFEAAFIHKTDSTLLQLFRYGFVAGAAFLVDFGILILLKEYGGLNYLLAASLSFLAGAVVNFWLSIRWIFLNPKTSKRHYEFIGVLAVATSGLIINDALLWVLTSRIGIYYLASKLITTALIFFWNFFVRKKLLYR